MDAKEMEQKLKDIQTKQEASEKSFQSKIDVATKDFELKLESAHKDATEWKTVAEQREEENRQFQEKLEDDKKASEKKFAESRKAEILQFVESSINDGRIIPAQKNNVIKLMESMTSDATVIEFSEKDGSKKSHTQLSLFRAFVSGMKTAVSYGEHLPMGDRPAPLTPDSGDGVQEFVDIRSEGQTIRLPVEGADLAVKAFEYQKEQAKAGQTVSYEEALIALSPRIKTQA